MHEHTNMSLMRPLRVFDMFYQTIWRIPTSCCYKCAKPVFPFPLTFGPWCCTHLCSFLCPLPAHPKTAAGCLVIRQYECPIPGKDSQRGPNCDSRPITSHKENVEKCWKLYTFFGMSYRKYMKISFKEYLWIWRQLCTHIPWYKYTMIYPDI